MTDDEEQGRGGLGAKVAGLARRALPQRDTVGRNAVAGLTVTVGNLPSAMANGLLAGVNPLYGLYANMVGPIVGGALASNPLMVINSTSAAALVVGQSLTGVPADEQESVLFLTVVLAGALMVLFGVLGLGRLLRFVSFSVMTGFVAGIAVTLTLSQLPTITGTSPEGSTEVAQTVDLLGNLDAVDLPTLGLAVLTLALAATLPHTPLSKVASLLAIVVPTVLVALLGLGDVQVVSDVSEISGGLPLPVLPALSAFSPDVVTAAFAVAVVILAQGAGVSQSVSGSDSGRSSPSRDFVAQGAGNVVAGFFRGLPVGGSLSGTVLNVSSGARGRWAVIFSGLWMIVVVVAFAGAVSLVVMPALAALLVFAGLQSIKPSDVAEVWRAGWLARVGAIVTFVATILLPIQVAVVIGIVLAGLLYVVESSTDISVVALVQRPDGAIEEQQPPERLPGGEVTVLDVYGDLFYASARTLERRLPQPGDDPRPVVVLRLHGRPSLGATAVQVLSGYASRLRAAEGRLYLSGLSEGARDHLLGSGLRPNTGVHTYTATSVLGESTRRARDDASAWLARQDADDRRGGDEQPPDDDVNRAP
jgi:sulfate permease, SulP family